MEQSNLLTRGAGVNAGWRQLYAAAVLELDDARLADRIAKALAAMREAAEASRANEEGRALNDGFRILRVLENMTRKERSAA